MSSPRGTAPFTFLDGPVYISKRDLKSRLRFLAFITLQLICIIVKTHHACFILRPFLPLFLQANVYPLFLET